MARILIVDNDEDLSALLMFWAAREGHEAALTPGRPDDVRDLSGNDFDLALLDCGRPLGRCLSRSQELRAQLRQAGVPVVLLTTSATESEIEAARDGGVTAHLDKPFPLRRLAATIDQVLHDRRAKA